MTIISAIGRDYGVVDPRRPIMYPSNKGRAGGALAREASTVHDMTTLFMPDTHDEANIAHHLDHFADELATDEAVFCISEATRASLVAADPFGREQDAADLSICRLARGFRGDRAQPARRRG